MELILTDMKYHYIVYVRTLRGMKEKTFIATKLSEISKSLSRTRRIPESIVEKLYAKDLAKMFNGKNKSITLFSEDLLHYYTIVKVNSILEFKEKKARVFSNKRKEAEKKSDALDILFQKNSNDLRNSLDRILRKHTNDLI